MKTLFWILAGLALTAGSGCFIDLDDEWPDCINGRGDFITREYRMPYFDAIQLRCGAEVVLTQGNEIRVLAEGYENILDALDFDLNGRELAIDNHRCIDPRDQPRILITMPDLRRIDLLGYGNLFSQNFFIIDDLEIRLLGSGDIDLGLDADDLELSLTGSGDILLEGSAQNLRLDLLGSGDLRAFPLAVDRADIRITGSGDAEVNVLDFLEVYLTGSGDVIFRGNPVIDLHVTGTGRLINGN